MFTKGKFLTNRLACQEEFTISARTLQQLSQTLPLLHILQGFRQRYSLDSTHIKHGDDQIGDEDQRQYF